MLKYKIINIFVMLFLLASPLFAGGSQAQATAPQASSGGQAVQNWSPYPNDEIGGTNSGTGQMRTTTSAMRQAAASQRKQVAAKTNLDIAGVDKNSTMASALNSDAIAPLATMAPALSAPDYFGVANWANSPLPTLDANGAVVPGTGMRKFVDTLPGLCDTPTANGSGTNDLGQCLPVAVPDTATFQGSDYYEIALVQYNLQMHKDLPPTLIRGYVQISPVQTAFPLSNALPGGGSGATATATVTGGVITAITVTNGGSGYNTPQIFITDPTGSGAAFTATTTGGVVDTTVVVVSGGANYSTTPIVTIKDSAPILDRNNSQVYGVTTPQYLGPVIVASGCDLTSANGKAGICAARPVRVKFTNYLPTGAGGDLEIPTDTTYMGAGMGPGGSIYAVDVSAGGSGYTSTPAVSITGGSGTGATAVAAINNGQVVSVLVTNGGSGYTTADTLTVSFTGGGGTGAAATVVVAGDPGEMYTQNRATLHLHGGNTPWISDGTPMQWTVPVGEVTSYQKGDSVGYVPDMWFDTNGNLIPDSATCTQGTLTCTTTGADNNPGQGSLTFYWTNQQTGRLMFYHDHAYGITRLNVYAGEAAGYLLADPVQEDALAALGVPGTVGTTPDLAHMIPLVFQDKTFVPDSGVAGGQLAATDPTWDVTKYGGKGNLWFPHVYIPNQNPADVTGANNFGRWDYGPWFWPPQDPSTFVAGGQPYQCSSAAYASNPPAFPPLMCPGFPNPSGTPEAFMDTPVINGTAYPTLTVDPTAYRFQLLNAANDRSINLGLYQADPLTIALTSGGSNYTAAPTVGFINGAGGTGAAATAVMSYGAVTALSFTNVGAGYTADPNITITGDGTGAAATVTYDPISGTLQLPFTITNMGTGYTYANVTIDPPSCTPLGTSTCATATAMATITPVGVVIGVVVTNPGSTPWTAAPTVTFTNAAGDTTGSGAAAIASVNSEVKMVPAVPPMTGSALQPCATANPTGGAMLVSALPDANGNPLNNTGLPANCWPSAWPTDGRDGGVPDPTTAGPPIIQIGAEGGLLPNPVVIPSTPVGYEYNRRSITVLNVFTHGLLVGPAERADFVVDFSQFAGQTLIVYNDSPAPIPAFDSRNDYYTGDVDQITSGGAPTTLPGYGPNTRTIMQIKVNAAATQPLPTTPFSLSALVAGQPPIFAATQPQIIVPEPSYPTGNGNGGPAYARIQDTSMTGWLGTGNPLQGITLTSGGAGYTAAPNVTFSGGVTGGSGAIATATVVSGVITAITVTNGGQGYIAPKVVITDSNPSATGATFNVTVNGGAIASVAVKTGGTGYTTPTVSFINDGGAVAVANLAGVPLASVTLTNGGSGYTSAPTVSFSGTGTGAAATAVLSTASVAGATITNQGNGYTSPPTVTFSAPPSGTTATGTAVLGGTNGRRVVSITITNGGTGYVTAPTITISGGGGSGARAVAVLTPKSVASVTLTNPGSGYTAPPTVAFSGGGGSGAQATAALSPTVVASLTLTNPGSGYTSAPTITIDPPQTAGSTATAVVTTPVTQFQPKTIQELFTLDYGRMNATLGVELPFTNFLTQTTIPYGYVDPPTELFKDGDVQIWKITHNGVDTHFIHVHLFTVQVINRVGWDGMIKPPDENELGWKDTMRMNPLEDIIIALHPMKQVLPWDLPLSIRPMDTTEPIGSSHLNEFTNVDTANQPAAVTNDVINFGYEYVWHCHILGHEENDMMRAMMFAVPPAAPSGLGATTTSATRAVKLSWTDNSLNESGFTIQRSITDPAGTSGPSWVPVGTAPAMPATGGTATFVDTTVARHTSYWYQVVADNVVGYTQVYAAPAVGYPNLDAASTADVMTLPVTTNNSGNINPFTTASSPYVFNNSFLTGTLGWAGAVGDVQVSQAANMDRANAKGMQAALTPDAPQGSFVVDTSPANLATYDAAFEFKPNTAVSGSDPVDIFVGLDQTGLPAFGIQYQRVLVEAEPLYQVRSWVQVNGDQLFSGWVTIENLPTRLELAWSSGASAGTSLYVNDILVQTLTGDTSGRQLVDVMLGPSGGLSGASGSMYFDEFTSTNLNGVGYSIYLPLTTR